VRALLQWTIPALALALVPLFIQSPYALHIFILLFIAVALGESWNVIGGFAGQYSVGHAAWYGLGAYGAFILLQRKGIPPWFGVWAAVAIAVIIALAVGWITFRLRGPYFVLASIAVAEIIRLAALNWKILTNGAEGILGSDLPPLQIAGTVITDWNSKMPYYYLGLMMAVFCVAVNFAVKRSKLGYYLQAIREDQDAAHSLGIALTFYKNTALGISAACTALTGGFAAFYVGFIEPQGAHLHHRRHRHGDRPPPRRGGAGAALRVAAGLARPGPPPGLRRAGDRGDPGDAGWLRRLRRAPAAQEGGGEMKPLLEVRNVSRYFGGVKANQDVSFSVEPGIVLGLIGPNGAGKTTLFNCITGFYPPSRGEIIFDGQRINGYTPDKVCKLGMARTWQKVRPLAKLTVLENAVVGALCRTASVAEAKGIALEQLRVVGLERRVDVLAGGLPIGERKKLELARVLATKPRMILLDEVMGGLNARESEEIIQLILDVRKRGLTQVVIEHDMKAIVRTSDRIVVLNSGEKLAEGTPQQVVNDPRVLAAYLGDSGVGKA
jgi:branched-chain amino acid transport system ATP-binding protein